MSVCVGAWGEGGGGVWKEALTLKGAGHKETFWYKSMARTPVPPSVHVAEANVSVHVCISVFCIYVYV